MNDVTSTQTWKKIPDFALYEVSDGGQVRNRVTGAVRKPYVDRDGYQRLRLYRNGRAVNRSVHGLVLEAFVGPRPDGMEGCHGDGDKSNNSISNLRWDTHRANMGDLRKLGSSKRTHCPQGHELGGANMRPGNRACLSCNRARAYARAKKIQFSKQLADSYYERLAA